MPTCKNNFITIIFGIWKFGTVNVNKETLWIILREGTAYKLHEQKC